MARARRISDERHDVISAAGDVKLLFNTFCGEDEVMLVERIVVKSDSVLVPTVDVFDSFDVDQSHRKDGTPNGLDDIADEINPIYIPGGRPILIYFAAGTPGKNAWCNIQVRIVPSADSAT